jgi:hypothetical protein
MDRSSDQKTIENLPQSAQEFIKLVIKNMRYRRTVRRDVQAELIAHFEDELRDCTYEQQRQQKAQQLIEQFGDPKLLGILLRRAKKRCRPLWQKAFVRTLQVLLVFVAYFLICLTPLLVGKAEINTDYLQWLTDNVRAGHNKEDNARPLYDKAAEYYVKEPNSITFLPSHWPGDMNEILQSELKEWLSQNQKAMELFREAAQKPYFWYDYKPEQAPDKNEPVPATYGIISPILTEIIISPSFMKDLAKYKRLAQMARAYIFLEAYDGDTRQAFADSFALIKFGQGMQGKGLLVEQLVGIAIEALGHSALTTILAQIDVSADLLESAQRRIDQEVIDNQTTIDFEAEKAFWYDFIQRSFTNKGDGRGRPLLKALPYVATNWHDTLRMFFTFDLPGRREVVKDVNMVFEQSSLLLEMPPADSSNEALLTKGMKDRLPLMIRELLPVFEQISRLTWRLRTGRRGLPATFAAFRFCKENGNYPDSLDQLVSAGYLQQIPIDPYTREPLLYRKDPNGFVLYSVGLNRKDDGGHITYSKFGRVEQWLKDGDYILWPVQK